MKTAKTQKKTAPGVWAGRIMSTLAILFLLLDGTMKLFKPAPVIKATLQLGYPESSIIPLGILLLSCVLIYLVPRTAVLGAILLTGYLGGAVASHLRLGDPLFSHVLFPVYIGALIWGGIYLRDERLRFIVPFRNASAEPGKEDHLWHASLQTEA